MQVIVETDRAVGIDAWSDFVEARVRYVLERHPRRFSEVRVQLAAEPRANGAFDMHCRIDAASGGGVLRVEHLAPSTDLALHGALVKLSHAADLAPAAGDAPERPGLVALFAHQPA